MIKELSHSGDLAPLVVFLAFIVTGIVLMTLVAVHNIHEDYRAYQLEEKRIECKVETNETR